MNKSSDEKTKIVINAYNNSVDEYIEYYNNELLNIEVEFKREIEYLIKNTKNNASILDAGTSIGMYPRYLTEKSDKEFDIIGIDLSENMLKHAVKNVPKAKFQKMDIRHMDFNGKKFDLIICFAVLNHMDDETCLKILNSFDELLNNDGRVAINVMEYEGGKKELYIKEPLNPIYDSYFNKYSKQFFIDFFNSKNYIIEKIFDNRTIDEPVIGVGEDLAGANQFSIIARESKMGISEV